MRKARRVDQIAPDGPLITISWENMVPGASVFIPCRNTALALKQCMDITKPWGWKLKSARRIESGLYGIRIWREL